MSESQAERHSSYQQSSQSCGNGYKTPKEQRDEARKELDKAEGQLKTDQGKVVEDTKAKEKAQAEFNFLDNVVKEIEQTVNGYDQAQKGLEDDKKELEKYADLKYHCAVGVLGPEKRKALDDKIKHYDETTVPAQRKCVEGLKDKVKQAADAYEKAQAAVVDAQKTYDQIQGYLKAVQGILKKGKDLRKPIDEQEAQGHPGKMYVLITVLQGLLKDPSIYPKIKTKEQLEKALSDAWNTLHAAKVTAQAKKDDWEKAKKELEAAQKKLQDLIDNRTQNLLKEIVGEDGAKAQPSVP